MLNYHYKILEAHLPGSYQKGWDNALKAYKDILDEQPKGRASHQKRYK